MNDKVLIIQDIEKLKKNINDSWIDINNNDLKKLKEAWNSPACIQHLEKIKKADAKIISIINRLDYLKKCWENYGNINTTGGTKNE